MTIFTVPASGGGGLSPPAGPTSGFFRYTTGGGVGPGGTQYLQLGNAVFSSEAGDLLTADGTLIGISFALDSEDFMASYEKSHRAPKGRGKKAGAQTPLDGMGDDGAT